MSRNAMRLAACLLLIMLLIFTLGTASAQGQIEVIVNDVVVETSADGTAHRVTAYVTVIGPDGQPISGLTANDFAVSQDGNSVMLDSVASARRSISVVLAIDTSGSMAYQGKMDAVKAAATGFLDHLRPIDKVAVVFFGDRIVVGQQDLTSDVVLMKNVINLLQAEPNAGTCLYDAAYKSIVLASNAPPGCRMLVLITDGVDARADQSGRCSQHTVDDVIALAQGMTPDASDTRLPIYTIGVGDFVDAKELERIAASTGGDSLSLSDPTEVSSLFDTVAAQMQNQYELAYQVGTIGGEHSLTVSVDAQDIVGVGTSRFLVPEPPPTLSLSGLENQAVLDGHAEILAAISGGSHIARVLFTLDGDLLSEMTKGPFAVELDADVLPPGQHVLAVVAQLDDGTELSETLTFDIHSKQSEIPVEESLPEMEETSNFPGWIVSVGAAGAIVLLSTTGVLVLIRSRSQTHLIGKGAVASGRSGGAVGLPVNIAEHKFATLRVQDSLTLHRDQVFDLATNEVTIGSGADNDIVVPDESVSRNHAVVRRKGEELHVFDCDSTHGTFVNGIRVEEEGLQIQGGDILLLGSRTAMTFHILHPQMVVLDDEDYDTSAGAVEDEPSETDNPDR